MRAGYEDLKGLHERASIEPRKIDSSQEGGRGDGLALLQGLMAKQRRDKDEQIALLREENIRLRQFLVSLQAEQSICSRSLELANQRVSVAERRVEQLEREVQQRKHQIEQLLGEQNELLARASKYQLQCAQLHSQIETVKVETERLVGQRQKAREVVQLQTLRSMVDKLERSLQESNELAMELERILGVKQNELNEINKRIAEKDLIAIQIQQKFQLMDRERLILAASSQNQLSCIGLLQEELQKVYLQMQYNSMAADSEKQELMSRQQSLVQESEQRARAAMEANQEKGLRVKALEAQIRSKEEQVKKLEQQLAVKEKIIAEEGARSALERTRSGQERARLSTLEGQVVRLSRQLESKDSSWSAAKREASSKSEQLGRLQEELRQSRTQLQKERKKNIHLEQLYAKYRTLKQLFCERDEQSLVGESINSHR